MICPLANIRYLHLAPQMLNHFYYLIIAIRVISYINLADNAYQRLRRPVYYNIAEFFFSKAHNDCHACQYLFISRIP